MNGEKNSEVREIAEDVNAKEVSAENVEKIEMLETEWKGVMIAKQGGRHIIVYADQRLFNLEFNSEKATREFIEENKKEVEDMRLTAMVVTIVKEILKERREEYELEKTADVPT